MKLTLDGPQLEQFLADDPGGPVVMLNLLRFAPGGEASYRAYIEQFSATGVNERYGVEIVYGGAGSTPLATPGGPDWDMVALVRYPSRKHFVDMVNDPDYKRFEHLRIDAIAETVLQPTSPVA